MGTGMVLTVAQTLFAALQSKELRELASMLKYKSKLDDLQKTVTMIKAVLLDAESKHQELTPAGHEWIERLKDSVYDADDLFDEFITTVQQLKKNPGSKISKKVRRFFSGDNQLLFAFSTSREIKKLREKLDGIAKDFSEFGLSDVYQPVKRSREETCSYVFESSIIGRETDKEAIVGMLLSSDPNSNTFGAQENNNVSFVTIVGIGGLGKTALAQLVFNDDRIEGAFKDYMKWVCVSEEFGMKEILCKLLGENGLSLEEMQRKVRGLIQGGKYMIVLDDVWSENRGEWIELRDFLSLGARGSKVLVTSRSVNVANAIGEDPYYRLQGLSDDDSWDLFKRTAFKQGQEHEDPDLVSIGEEIVKGCANVPLAIRVTGSLLYGQDKNKWLSYKISGLTQGENDIMSILKFSYYQLSPALKSCFSFCSLFPKDFEMKKRNLISLWLAEGYLIPSFEGQSLEEVGEDYFWLLLQRGFFQEIKLLDGDDENYIVKMHDLIHDLAQKVAGTEALMLAEASRIDGASKIRHLSIARNDHTLEIDDLFGQDSCRKSLRTYMQPPRMVQFKQHSNEGLGNIIAGYRGLRVLDLHKYDIRSLPDAIGKLLHLRYLDLSFNYELKKLPISITKLLNLQILNLSDCYKLVELPRDICKLINLRELNLTRTSCLTHMPPGMENLKCLHTLPQFAVGRNDINQVQMSELIELKALVKLRGSLYIYIPACPYVGQTASSGDDILRNAHLKTLIILFTTQRKALYDENSELNLGRAHETLMEGLNPNPDLLKFKMYHYLGTKLPTWTLKIPTYLPRLVRIKLADFEGQKHLTPVSQLCHLKHLSLLNMPEIDYIESAPDASALKATGSVTFFPSLEKLKLINMPKLKGWWRDFTWMNTEDDVGCLVDGNGREEEALTHLSFPSLHCLQILECESMTYMPYCPRLQTMDHQSIIGIHDSPRLNILLLFGEDIYIRKKGKIRDATT